MKKLSDCKVLIVDDTEANLDILVEVLCDDYDVMVATDGEAALEILAVDRPDIILLDILMPGMDGYEVCKKIKRTRVLQDIPIIFLTAMTDITSKTKGFELGAVDYITKPFEALEVKARVKTHLSLKLANYELSIQNEILEDKVKERTKEITITQEATIEAMACLAEFHDSDTGMHIKRTKNYIKILAQELRKETKYKDILTDETIDTLYKSAPLHDIGKIGVRYEILKKNGRLTTDEFTEMKMHTLMGYESLVNLSQNFINRDFLKCAMEIARSHQEKWDGTGYPDGLKGDNIPLSGRIMAVADVYDALISKRCYKDAFSHEKSVEIMRGERGTHFDPDILDAFLSIKDQFHMIAVQYRITETIKIVE